MVNKNYIAGRRFEYKVKKHFESMDFHVIRSAGSHSAYDLIAYCPQLVVLIQCKNQQPTKQEINDFNLESKYLNPDALVIDFEVLEKVKQAMGLQSYPQDPSILVAMVTPGWFKRS